MGLREQFSEIRRLEQIAACLFKHEFYSLITALQIKRHLPLRKQISLDTKEFKKVQPHILRGVFEELGGAFLKLGQMISLRPDLVGFEFAKEFEKMLDSVPPEDFKTIVKVIRQNLKGGMHNFKEFDSNPLASGSIAQVHKAVLENGKHVAVKVQRPGIREKFMEDISIIESLAKSLSANPDWQFVDLYGLVEEFKKYTLKELDFNHEAISMVRFRKNFQGNESIVIPQVYRHYSNDKILVMEFVEGIDIHRIRHRLSPSEKRHVVETISGMAIKQIFEDGFFHADLHPGNIMYLRSRKIAVLDYGIVGYLDRELKENLFGLFSALVKGDLIEIADSLIELNVGHEDIDREALKAGLHYTLSDFYNQSVDSLPMGEVFGNALETARRSKLKMPSNLVLIGKTLLTIDGLCRELDSDFNFVRFAKPFIKKISKEELSPRRLKEQTLSAALGLKRLITRTPRYLENFNRQISLVDSRLGKYEQMAEAYQESMARTSKSILYSLFAISLMITSALLIDKGPIYKEIPIYSFLGLCVTLIMLITVLKTLNTKNRR